MAHLVNQKVLSALTDSTSDARRRRKVLRHSDDQVAFRDCAAHVIAPLEQFKVAGNLVEPFLLRGPDAEGRHSPRRHFGEPGINHERCD